MKTPFSIILFYLTTVMGLGIALFKDLPEIINAGENLRTVIARLCFIFLQVLVYSAGMITIWVMLKNSLSKKIVVFLIMLIFIIISLRINYDIHEILLGYNLYINVPEGSKPFFLHAVVLLSGVGLIFALGYFLIFKKTILKIFTMFFCISFFSFFYFAHYYLGKQAYLDYLNQARLQISFILNNNDNSENICNKLKYQCFIVDNNSIPNLIFDNKNRMNPAIDSTQEGIEIFKNSRADFLNSGDNEKIFVTDDFPRKNVRAVNYAFKKTSDGKMFVVLASHLFAYGLDLYLFYITLVNAIFLIVWLALLFILYNIHKVKPVVNKLNLLEDLS